MQPNSTINDSPRAWLAAALRGGAPPGDAPAASLLACAQKEGVAALVHALGATRALPAEVVAEFAAFEKQRIAVEMLARRELAAVMQALAGAQVPFLLLKGTALAYSVYPAPHLRPRSDVDLLFPDQATMLRACAALADIGYTASQVPDDSLISYEKGLHRTTPGGHAHHLDMHWKIANQALFADALPWHELAAAAIGLPALDPAARALSPVHALLHACMHRISHLPWDDDSGMSGDRLIWLYDFHLLAQRIDAQGYADFRRIAGAQRLAGVCLDGLRQAQNAFATPLPAGLLDDLARTARSEPFDARHARIRWYQEWHNLRAQPLRRKLAFAREKLFPSRAYMREQYPVDGPLGLAVAYLRRLGNGLRMTVLGRR